MAFSNLIAYFIILTTAVTLHAHGKTDIDTAAQAAEALRPIAGAFASLLFSLGVIGTGLLALPVLGGSAAYAVGEALRWPVGLERKTKEAKAFYAVLALATLVGLALNFTKVDAIKALVWAAVINGVTAAPVIRVTFGVCDSMVPREGDQKRWISSWLVGSSPPEGLDLVARFKLGRFGW
jgi:Mn2+/Fe2+ NRAMP family transporter